MQVPTTITERSLVGPWVPRPHNLGICAAERMEFHFATRMGGISCNNCWRNSSVQPCFKAKEVQFSEWKQRLVFSGPRRSHIKLHEGQVCGGMQFPHTSSMFRKLAYLQNAPKRRLDQPLSVRARNCVDTSRKSTCGFTDNQCVPEAQGSVEGVSKKSNKSLVSALTAILGSFLILTAPGPNFTDFTLTFDGSASADQFGQLRALERAAESLSKVGVQEILDKAVTVVTSVTGISYVDPEKLDKEVDGVLSGEKDIKEDVFQGIKSLVENSWHTVFDLVTNFNPISFSESAGSTVSGFLETGAERIAAFELTTLVSFAERWAILTPLFVLPMAWEMKRIQAKKDRESRDKSGEDGELSLEAQVRGEKVRLELERIELRTLIFEAVDSLGQTALQPPRSRADAGMIRRRISDLLQRLEELNPVEDTLMSVPDIASSVSSKKMPNDALAYIPTTPTVDGDWNLIYVSETTDSGGFQVPSFFPGVGLDKLRQTIWQKSDKNSTMEEAERPLPTLLLARNTAEFRLGPLGVFQVGIHGSWENLEDNQRAQVSFNQVSARPLEILGNKVSEDVPDVKLTLPTELQRSAEWGLAYVDDQLRISRGSRGQTFVFRRED